MFLVYIQSLVAGGVNYWLKWVTLLIGIKHLHQSLYSLEICRQMYYGRTTAINKPDIKKFLFLLFYFYNSEFEIKYD